MIFIFSYQTSVLHINVKAKNEFCEVASIQHLTRTSSLEVGDLQPGVRIKVTPNPIILYVPLSPSPACAALLLPLLGRSSCDSFDVESCRHLNRQINPPILVYVYAKFKKYLQALKEKKLNDRICVHIMPAHMAFCNYTAGLADKGS